MKQIFEHKDSVIEYTLIYSERNNIEIQIKRNGVRVVSPMGIKSEEIIELVKLKGDWIIEKIDEINNNPLYKTNNKYCDGEFLLFLGKLYQIKLFVDERVVNFKVKLDKDFILITCNTSDPMVIKQGIEIWYKEQATIIIEQAISNYQRLFEEVPRKIVIKAQKKRWGSCNSYKDIYFNWKCIMAPLKVIEYLVVHEMCHMVHLNHSKAFWDKVCEIMPDYKIHRKWLKENGIHLDF